MSRDLEQRATGWVIARTGLTPAVWGTTYVVTSELLPQGRPMLAATVRALPVGLLLVAWGRTLPIGHWWWRSAVLGALNIGAFFGLLFVAAFRLPGGVAATIGALQPLVAAGLARGLLGEHFSRRTAAAGVVGVAGIALLVLRPGAHLDVIGVAAAVAATMSMATGVVLTKRWGRPTDLVAFTGWQLTAGGLALVPVLALTEGVPSALTHANIAGFAWIAVVGTGIAYANWFRGIQVLPVATASTLGLLSPVVATTSGWILLGQHLDAVQLCGAALVPVAFWLLIVTPGSNNQEPEWRVSTSGCSTASPPPPSPGGTWPPVSPRRTTSRSSRAPGLRWPTRSTPPSLSSIGTTSTTRC